MLTLSTDPARARFQMEGLILYLASLAYIDGEFDPSEREYIVNYIREVLEERYMAGLPDAAKVAAEAVVEQLQTHFEGALDDIIVEMRELWTESINGDAKSADFVQTRQKVRCFEVLRDFDQKSRDELMAAAEELALADGHVHAAEAEFHEEMNKLLDRHRGIEPSFEIDKRPPIYLEDPIELDSSGEPPEFLAPLERHYSSNTQKLAAQLEEDRLRMRRFMRKLDEQRAIGEGNLEGRTSVLEFRQMRPFLDGYTYVVPPRRGQTYELTVLGDLHGCYSCLKAALVQSRFFDKVAEWKKSPRSALRPMLVFLGDYIDRGYYGFDGVLRAVMEIFLAAPDNVFVLRGNHEWYREKDGKYLPAVAPAEAFSTLYSAAGGAIFRTINALFESLPAALIFDQLLFVHAGIPPEGMIKEHFVDLASMNEWAIRFWLMWGDPSPAAVVPRELQKTNTGRFSFGRLQAQNFLERLGAHTIFRGHEKVVEGFRPNFDEGAALLYTLFSAGGADNDDLPATSNYRKVTPTALTLTYLDGETWVEPWAIDYKRFNNRRTNGFYAFPRELGV